MYQFDNFDIALIGYLFCLLLLPRPGMHEYLEKLVGYVISVLLLIIATSEFVMYYPIPFYFMLGGFFTLFNLASFLYIQIFRNKQ